MAGVNHVLRYLASTSELKLHYKKCEQALVGYVDADWGGDHTNRRSYTGYVFYLAGGAISWKSEKQHSVALSSTEAEYMVLSAACKEAVALRRLFVEIGCGDELQILAEDSVPYLSGICLKISSRIHDNKVQTGSTGPANNKVESMASKRQRSAESPKQGAPVSKKLRASGSTNTDSNRTKQRATVAETARRHLAVALIDRGDPNGKMSAERWRLTHSKLVDALFVRMENVPDSPMPTFEGTGWLNGVKILTCKDDPTLQWLQATVPKLDGLWEGAKLDVVDRNNIPSMPKAKVLFPIVVQGERALQLLKKQNPAIPTSDWSVLKVNEPLPSGGQHVIIQINKEAEDLLYKRNGKMAWGLGSVYLRLKKRHPNDNDTHTLRSGEVEADLGLESVTDATQHLSLTDKTEEVGEELSMETGPPASLLTSNECAATQPP
ncbi:uncharacterized protein LOC127566244 [Drosophila albomicans]|uniref:Uncharacterized protein LOC127566244 n=1 Tax=Drosophila albomicans TaxID=7291 RepID=A0A9C6WJ25_DROAB|nr:uncharacterized protein LOC127566244 [Drosophila albomicans]